MTQDEKEKKNEYKRKYYQANKKRIMDSHKQYRQANKEKEQETSRKYYQANKKKIKEREAQYYQANKEKFAVYSKQYRQDNRERVKEGNKRYQLANKEKIAAYNKKYRDGLEDGYVKTVLRLTNAPKSLIEAKRIHIKCLRLIKELQDGTEKKTVKKC